MSYLDAYLEPCAAYGWEGGPRFNTLIVPLSNGDEYRNGDWIEARHGYTAPFQNISAEAYRSLKKMFLVCRGMLHAFRFIDELDNEAVDEVFGAGDGTTTGFQLSKTSTVDGVDYVRNVYATRGAIVCKVDGVVAPAAVNPRTGWVELDDPPADGAELTWSGGFDIWVRFATDDLRFSLDDPDATNGAVQVIEVVAPDED